MIWWFICKSLICNSLEIIYYLRSVYYCLFQFVYVQVENSIREVRELFIEFTDRPTRYRYVSIDTDMSSTMSGLWWTAKTCHRACTWQRYLNRCGCDLLTLSCLRPCQVWWIGQTCHRACTWQRYRNKCCFNLLTMSGLWWTARTCHRACTWQRYRNEFTRNHFIPSFCSINRRI